MKQINYSKVESVLILVVMDVALGQGMLMLCLEGLIVLILVVMDVALGQMVGSSISSLKESLNPCCNGCRTWADRRNRTASCVLCLNPCCNGCRTWAGGCFECT